MTYSYVASISVTLKEEEGDGVSITRKFKKCLESQNGIANPELILETISALTWEDINPGSDTGFQATLEMTPANLDVLPGRCISDE
jgi:hypothetical protein